MMLRFSLNISSAAEHYIIMFLVTSFLLQNAQILSSIIQQKTETRALYLRHVLDVTIQFME